MDKNQIQKIRKSELMAFVGDLHKMQLEMIDAAVEIKEKEGFPEANAVIDYIRQKTIGNQ